MVQWKGNISKEQAGTKAANLDSIQSLDVPNFFVLTKQEIGENLETTEPRQILNTRLPQSLKDKIKNAYDEIGMSSEVRNASGPARDLVGGQRENQKISIRISSQNTESDYKLNIGSSKLESALKQILASHYKQNNTTPAVIFQKMIEPDQTGAIITNYTQEHTLIETVEGLGHSLEEAQTVPELYLVHNNQVTQTRIPEKQVKITRNPMNGQRRTRKVAKNHQTLQNSEIKKLAHKASKEELSLKFAYKRGTFYIVDAFKNQPIDTEPDLEALKVSNGEITGRQGQDYILTEQPTNTDKPQVSKKGGYTSKQAQKARQNNTPAVFSLKNTEKIQKTTQKQEDKQQNNQHHDSMLKVTATEIRPIKDFPQLSNNPFGIENTQTQFADNCEDILKRNPELIDGRNIDNQALIKAMQTSDNIKALAISEADEKIMQKTVELGIQIIAVPEQKTEQFRTLMLRKEKQFILENLRN